MINLYKQLGETPLEAIGRLRALRPDLEKERLSYAGRLDPLAEGVLPIMVGEDNDRRDEYLYLPKAYEADIVFGVGTDTHDFLGIVSKGEQVDIGEPVLREAVLKFTGAFVQKYPAFSSKTVNGEPLFMKTRRGEKVELPTHEVFVKNLEIKNISTIESSKLLKNAEEAIAKVRGDFRQSEILLSWHSVFAQFSGTHIVVTISLEASSGFYVRALARDLGGALHTEAIASRILRTKVGVMDIKDSILR